MSGSCDFQITGQITYVNDSPPVTGRPYGSVRVRVQIPAVYIGMKPIETHGLFVGIRYNQNDTTNSYFNTFKSKILKDAQVFMRGALKPRAASADGKYPATLFLDAHWRNVKVSQSPFPARNKVYFDGEVVTVGGNRLNTKYSYMNPKEKDASKKWKDRQYEMIINPDAHVDVSPRDNVFVEGRILGKAPNGQDMVWILADEVY